MPTADCIHSHSDVPQGPPVTTTHHLVSVQKLHKDIFWGVLYLNGQATGVGVTTQTLSPPGMGAQHPDGNRRTHSQPRAGTLQGAHAPELETPPDPRPWSGPGTC